MYLNLGEELSSIGASIIIVPDKVMKSSANFFFSPFKSDPLNIGLFFIASQAILISSKAISGYLSRISLLICVRLPPPSHPCFAAV